jgi:hypothetical protein
MEELVETATTQPAGQHRDASRRSSGSTPAASKASRCGNSVCVPSDFETWT